MAAAVEVERGGGGGGAKLSVLLLSVRSIEEMYIEQIRALAKEIAFTKNKMPNPSQIAFITLI